MDKRALTILLALFVGLAVAIPLWAFSEEGDKDASAIATDSAEQEEAKELFVTACGQCHVMKAAGTDGVIGPNLDERLDGASSVERVLAAIEQGVGTDADGNRINRMPAGILRGIQAEEVAEYVAEATSPPEPAAPAE